MKSIVFAIGLLLLSTVAYAEYDVAKVVQIDPTKKDGTTEITVEFSGAGEQAVKRTLLAGPRHTKDMITNWASDQLVDLNGVTALKLSLAVNEVLPVVKAAK